MILEKSFGSGSRVGEINIKGHEEQHASIGSVGMQSEAGIHLLKKFGSKSNEYKDHQLPSYQLLHPYSCCTMHDRTSPWR
jgi:hypothetical protein